MDRIYVMQLVQSYQAGRLSRREFARRAGLALGSVAAASVLLAACAPISPAPREVVVQPTADAAEATAAGVEGVVAESITYSGPDGATLMGHLARPDDGRPHPGVVVIQEWWGLDGHIKDVTNRFAAAGYVALAPDLYHGVVASEPDEARKLVMELDMVAAVDEIGSALDALLARDDVSGEKAGIVGFCMGGRLTLLAARTHENIGAAVAFYGSPLTPAEAAEVKAPVLGLYGALDGGIAVADVETMRDALEAAGITTTVVIYEGAQHAFFNDTRANSYNAEASADAWTRTLAWFEEYLTG